MEHSRLAPLENVVRMIFPLTMMNEGELLPAAFKLREQKDGAEQFISVFRQYADTFHTDIRNFDKSRNLPCCLMNVGEVESTTLEIATNKVEFTVKATPTAIYASHAGIFISIAGIPIEGEGYQAFTTLNIGEESKFVMSAVRRRLVDIAKKRIMTVNQLLVEVIKFKTMTDERGADGKLLPDAERLTKVGRIVRSTSIDELPQLINVLKGDMALIGPRPLLPKYLPLYSEEQMRRHEVRPGISGWAQCHGRNAISFTERFKLDVWYVDHCTLWTDIQVIWITVMKVLKRDGISEDGQATMETFNGHN